MGLGHTTNNARLLLGKAEHTHTQESRKLYPRAQHSSISRDMHAFCCIESDYDTNFSSEVGEVPIMNDFNRTATNRLQLDRRQLMFTIRY